MGTVSWWFSGSGASFGSVSKEFTCNAGDLGSIPGLGRSLEEEMATLSSILAGESHGQRSLAGYRPWGHKESDMTEHSTGDFMFLAWS